MMELEIKVRNFRHSHCMLYSIQLYPFPAEDDANSGDDGDKNSTGDGNADNSADNASDGGANTGDSDQGGGDNG